MKQIILILIVSGFFLGCSESDFKERKFGGLNGNPKSIKDTKYEAIEKFGEVVEQSINNVLYYEFGKHGYAQKIIHYNSIGDIIYSETHTFESGKCIEITTYQKYNDITSTIKLKNRTPNSETWEKKTSLGETTISYSEYENMGMTTVTKDLEDNIVSQVELVYDDNRNIVEHKYSKHGEVLIWEKSTFNDKSQEIKIERFLGYEDGIYFYKYDCFDKKRNWTKKIEYNKDGEIKSLTIREIIY